MSPFQKINGRKALCVVSLLLVMPSVLGRPKLAHASDTMNRTAEVICKNWPMPSSYVIVSVRFSQSCSGLAQNIEYTVSPPSDGMVVCNNFSIPSPYVITSLASSSKCNGLFDEGVIRHVADGISICGDGISPVPDGYIVTTASKHDAVTCHGTEIYRLSVATNGASMCSFSSRPPGFVVSYVAHSTQCLKFNAHVLLSVIEGVMGCSFSRLPDGYVVTAATQTQNCIDGDLRGDYWTFNQPYEGINVCPFSPIPSGYYLMGTVTKTNCYGASFGYLLKRP